MLFATIAGRKFEMQRIIVRQVDAFTSTPFGGNPAGVITEADTLTTEMMQKIASEMNLSESAYVTLPDLPDADFRLRFFTPEEEVNISGHATIASCYALFEDGRIPLSDNRSAVNIQTDTGLVQIDIHYHRVGEANDGAEEIGRIRSAHRTSRVPKETTRSEMRAAHEKDGEVQIINIDDEEIVLEKIMMHQAVHAASPADVSARTVAEILGIDVSEIAGTGLPLEIVSTGLTQLFVPILHKETILDMHPDLIKLGLMNKKNGIDTNHIFSLDAYREESVSYSRHFAPAVGMWEDPATGTAAAGLAIYLLRHGAVTSNSMIMEQGKSMSELAKIIVDVDEFDGAKGMVRVGGLAVTSIARKIEIDEDRLVLL